MEVGRLGGWERWERKIMGTTDSPYHEYQELTWAKELALGTRQDKGNPFKWERVVNNLPGTSAYE